MPPKRLPARLAAAAVRRARPAAWALFVLGVASFVLMPLAGKNCYLDEKALLVGGALPTVRWVQAGVRNADMRHKCIAFGVALSTLSLAAGAEPMQL